MAQVPLEVSVTFARVILPPFAFPSSGSPKQVYGGFLIKSWTLVYLLILV